MTDASGPWNIGDLADLILGAGRPIEPPAEPAGDSEPRSAAIITQVVLVNSGQDAVAAVGHYADYWSNRGQTVAVAWVGESGIKLGLYDHLRRVEWAGEFAEALRGDPARVIKTLIERHVRRLVVAVVTQPGWQRSPFVRCCASACVLVEPSPNQLVRAYECLKHLNRVRRECTLSCFVQDALSARQATELSSRLQHMGDHFLKREVIFEGFSLADPSPSSNLVEQCYLAADPAGGTAELRQALLECLIAATDSDDATAGEGPVCAAAAVAAPADPADRPEPAVPAGCLPTVRVLRGAGPICSVQQLDGLLGERIEALCSDVSRTCPVYTSPDSGLCFRWVIHRSGIRSLVVTLLGDSSGALEQAAARMHPLQPGDEIIVLAPALSSEHRRAAQALHPNTRLFEVAQMPADHEPAVLLSEVTHALG